MKETLNFMKHLIVNTNLEKETNEDLVYRYKQTQDQQILATLFCKNYSFFTLIGNRYQVIPESDRASLILEKLVDAINHYNEQTRFITYAGNIIIKYFKWYIGYVLAYKGRLNNSESLDQLMEDVNFQIEDNSFNNVIENINVEYILKNSNLTKREYQLCKLICSEDNVSWNDVAEKLGVTRLTVYNDRKQLQKKLSIIKELGL